MGRVKLKLTFIKHLKSSYGGKIEIQVSKYSYSCCFDQNVMYYTLHIEKTSQVNQGRAHIFSFEKELGDLNTPPYPPPTHLYYEKQYVSTL